MSRLQKVVLYILILFMSLISVISFASAVRLINRPFPGFLIYPFPYVGSYSVKDWSGREAGLKFMDRIVAVDGQPIFHGRKVFEIVKKKEPGTRVRYLVESKGQIREVTVPVSTFGVRDLLLTFGTIFPCGLILSVLSFIVVLLKPNMSSSWIFMVLGLSLGGYLISGLEIQTTHVLAQFHNLVTNLYPFANFHLALVFPVRNRVLNRFPALEYLIYVPAVVLSLAWLIYILTFPDLLRSDSLLSSVLSYKNLGSITRLLLFLSVLGFIILICRSVFKATSAEARQRARMILLGVAVGFLPPVAFMLGSHILKLDPTWNFLPFLVIFFPVSIAYSIVRHNLFDADIIIRRTVGYVVVSAVVVGAYAVVSLVLNILLEGYELTESRAFPILFTLGVILVFNPLRDRLQAIVDRVFFRKEYDYGAIVDKLGRAITTLLDLGQVLQHLTQTFVKDMFLNTTSVMLLNPANAEYRVYFAEGERKSEVEGKVFRRDRPLMQIVEKERREVTKYDVLEDPKYSSVSVPCAADFGLVGASLMVPLVFQDRVIGLLNLGEKKSGKPYNRQDIDLIHTVANQGAVAIENARLFQENLEKQRMEEELNIARDLQMSMLPAGCPQVAGFDLAATCIPAREVGGDFYDFFEMDDERLALIVGDVTGKSVSGALVMSAARSVFRMLSEKQEEPGVGHIMVRANRRAKKDMRPGMFIALLYALLDAKERTLSLCNAGQTQPIQFSSSTGAASLVETSGDTFPLGILEEADYEETRIRLEPGDRVVFYTDGIVEAMNDKKEIFGFERLLEVVKNGRGMDADCLLKNIMTRVKEFVGETPQSDDLTVIVLCVGD
jgi:serine phosphatase RsbU (regulator of sigma subunit)